MHQDNSNKGMTAQDVAYMRLLLQQQQAPTIQPIRANSVGEGIAQGAAQALNNYMRMRFQQQQMQQMQQMYQQAQARQQQQQQETMNARLGITRSAGLPDVYAYDDDLYRQAIGKIQQEQYTIAAEQRAAQNKQNQQQQADLRVFQALGGQVNEKGQAFFPNQQSATAYQNYVSGVNPAAIQGSLITNATNANTLNQTLGFQNANNATADKLQRGDFGIPQAQFQYGVDALRFQGTPPAETYPIGENTIFGKRNDAMNNAKQMQEEAYKRANPQPHTPSDRDWET